MDENKQLAKFDGSRILDVINQSPNLTAEDKRDLEKQMMSGNVEVQKKALEMLAKSMQAGNDLDSTLRIIEALDKKGIYISEKMTFEFGSGRVEVQTKGGDTKLIIPVLVILGIIIIAVLLIVFWD